MAFEDILSSTGYVTSELKKIRAAVASGDVQGALSLLAALKTSQYLDRISDLNMTSGKGLTFGGVVDFAERFLRENNQIQALNVLAGNTPNVPLPQDSPEKVLLTAALSEASLGNFRKAKDALAGISKGSRQVVVIQGVSYTLDQAIAFCAQALDEVNKSKEARKAVSWVHYVSENIR